MQARAEVVCCHTSESAFQMKLFKPSIQANFLVVTLFGPSKCL